MPIPFQTLRHCSVFVHPTDRQIYDPFVDSLHEEQLLQVPLAPSRPLTPAVSPAASNAKLDPAISQNAAALFDPLGFIPSDSRVIQEPAMAPMTRATPNTAYDPSARPKRRAAMLTISTTMNPPLPSSNSLEDLLGTRDKDGTGPSTNARIKPTRQFSTTPLFRPHRCLINILSFLLLLALCARASMFAVLRMTLAPSSPSYHLSIPSHQPTHRPPLVLTFSRGIKRFRKPVEYGDHHSEQIHDRSGTATRGEC
jgi:hypothetical protein